MPSVGGATPPRPGRHRTAQAAHPADQHDRYVASCLLAIWASGDVDAARPLADGVMRDVGAAGVPCAVVVTHIGAGELLADADPQAALAEMAFAIGTGQRSGCRFHESDFTPRFALLQALHGDPVAALRSLEGVRGMWSASTDAAVTAAWRSGVVVLLGRLGRFAQAATVHGSLDDAAHSTALMATVADTAGVIRAALSDADFARATRRGAAMAPHDADDFALAYIRQALTGA